MELAVAAPRMAASLRILPRRSPVARPGRGLAVSVRAQAGGAKPTVLVSEKLGAPGIAMLKEYANVDCIYDLTPAQLNEKIGGYDALIVRSATKVNRGVFEAAKGRLRVVGRAGVGIDNVDLVAATETGCLVVNAPTANTVAAAEHGIALMLALARNVAQADASTKSGKWERNKYVGVSITDKVLAIMGFGKVGSEVARRAKGLGMRVIAHDPYANAERAASLGVELVTLDAALAQGDFFSLHMPLTPGTNKMFNQALFAKMKKGARIVNVARGGVIDDAALGEALDKGIVAAAALDVFEEEPPAKDHPLVGRPDVVVTPHLGASTAEAQEGVAIEIADATIRALKGELASTVVNAPMVSSDVLQQLAPYLKLAEKLGRVAVQLVADGGVQDVQLSVDTSTPDKLDTRMLKAMVIKGVIEPISSTIVNIVNAEYTAKQRGLRITEVIGSTNRDELISSVTVSLKGASRFNSAVDGGAIKVAGVVKDGVPYLTRLGAFDCDVPLENGVLFCRQLDQPGMIGAIGTILAKANCNISFMSVSRSAPRAQAVMAVGLDEEPSADALKLIAAVDSIKESVFLKL